MLPVDTDFKGGGVGRIEVFTGAGSRRQWSGEETARIVAESYVGVEPICAVARRYGLAHPQILAWRRELRAPAPLDQMLAPSRHFDTQPTHRGNPLCQQRLVFAQGTNRVHAPYAQWRGKVQQEQQSPVRAGCPSVPEFVAIPTVWAEMR